MTVKINGGRSVAVDQSYYWREMTSCPVGTKVQLPGRGGVATYGKWNGKDDFWLAWAPLPNVPPGIKEKA